VPALMDRLGKMWRQVGRPPPRDGRVDREMRRPGYRAGRTMGVCFSLKSRRPACGGVSDNRWSTRSSVAKGSCGWRHNRRGRGIDEVLLRRHQLGPAPAHQWPITLGLDVDIGVVSEWAHAGWPPVDDASRSPCRSASAASSRAEIRLRGSVKALSSRSGFRAGRTSDRS